jgi:hypothetical protein
MLRGKLRKGAKEMRLADVLVEVSTELGGDKRPIHRSYIIPLAEQRWRTLGNTIKGDFGQTVSATIQEYSSDSSEWTKKPHGENLFGMHEVKGQKGYYSLHSTKLSQL